MAPGPIICEKTTVFLNTLLTERDPIRMSNVLNPHFTQSGNAPKKGTPQYCSSD